MDIVSRKARFMTAFCMWITGCGFFAFTLEPADALLAGLILLVACIALLAAEVW